MASQCLVSARDFDRYFLKGGVQPAPSVTSARAYTGPERRKNTHDRRWFAGVGGRRSMDRKS